MNKVFLLGNLTRDPELKYASSGKAYVRGSLAVNARTKDKPAEFYNFVLWDKTAELVAKYCNKGSKILIEGHLQTSTYEKNGVKHNAIDIIATSVEFAGGSGKKSPAKDNGWEGEPIDESDTPF